MSVTERTGMYGTYYGNMIGSSNPCNQEQKEANASYIYAYLLDQGWTINAIAGMLGNMQAESSINPGRWQSDDVNNTSLGYGLVQWTPTTKYTNWCIQQGLLDYSEMDSNLARIMYEVDNGLQWLRTSSYDITFEEFTISNLEPSYLAKAFVKNYERPADQSESVLAYRGSLADEWYEYLTGTTPPTPPPIVEKKKKKFNFILFNQRRRIIFGKRRNH